MSEHEQQWFTTGDVCRIFAVTRQTITQWLKTGHISGKMVDGRWMFTREELARVANQKYGTTREPKIRKSGT